MLNKRERYLKSTISNNKYSFSRLKEWGEEDEPLEVHIPGIEQANIGKGKSIYERFMDFIPFNNVNLNLSLGEGGTPLLEASSSLKEYCGLEGLLLKNETQNPTWSFKDRGSLACIWMAREMGERVTATISTGNMGHSISAYGGRAGLATLVFVPGFTPAEKLKAMALHGPTIVRVEAPDYSVMKKKILNLAEKYDLRIVSGNGPIRIEGYKFTAFELFEQLEGSIPDYIAVPTSACGHIRGIFKGFRELKKAGYVKQLPQMIIVQAKNNSPIVSAIKQGKGDIIPFNDIDTVAEAITSGNPFGGKEIIELANQYNWLAAAVTEEEILDSQRRLANSGYFVEPGSAVSLAAIRNLREKQLIRDEDQVVLMLTGSGFKDMQVLQEHQNNIELKPFDTDIEHLEPGLEWALNKFRN